MFVIGTAGHVDHGKSTLVKALTGIDPDRLKEEKERGLTIDLGFAWLELPSGREVSIVDVPGHERFINNMLAGVGGIDLALLVVAADEGVMAQTREHLAILDLLQVANGVVVIAKKDLVDGEWLELVTADVEELIQDTALAQAPIVATSATTGEGLPLLLETIDALLNGVTSPTDLGRPRLPIDRAFTMSGFGTVVTGTLIDGSLEVGQEVEVVPRGLRSRIRGLQTHKKKVEKALPGTRVAVNLSGLAPSALERGDIITTPGWLKPTSAIDVRLRLLRDLPTPLHHNIDVTFHSGASEALCKIRLLEKEELAPGELGWAQIRLARPLALVKNDLFILRSSRGTLGGGEVVDAHPKRHRRFHAPTLESLAVRERGSPQELALDMLRQREPCELAALWRMTNLPKDDARLAVEALAAKGDIIVLGDRGLHMGSTLLSAEGWMGLSNRTHGLVEAYHRQFPLRSGMPREELKSRLKLASRVFTEVVARLVSEGALVEEGPNLRLPEHRISLAPAQQRTADEFLRSLEASPYSPPTDQLPDPEVLHVLVEGNRVVKVAEGIFFSTAAYEDMVKKITEHIRAQGKITVGEVRDMFATSRKYALALLEHLDERKLTRRVGDERVLR